MPFPVTDFHKHLDGLNKGELRNWVLNSKAADPTGADLVAWSPWFNTTDGKFKYYDGTKVRTVGAEGGRKRGNHDASAGALPTAASATVDTGDEIADGDYFVITVAGTITDLPGPDDLEVGDLIYANKTNPTAAADFFAVQGNIAPKTGIVLSQVFEGQNLVADTPLDITPTDFSEVLSYEVYQGTEILTQSLASQTDATRSKITLQSLSDLTGLTVVLTGV